MAYNTFKKDPGKDAGFAQKARLYHAACVTYADAQIGKIINKLKENGADKNNAVLLWGDHGWYLGEQKIWGKHCPCMHRFLFLTLECLSQALSRLLF